MTERVALPSGEVELARPRDPEALISEEAFEHEEFLPYWAELWSSGVALAHDLARRALRGARTLELGCGLALPSIAAARAGGRVLATDWAPDAVAAAAPTPAATTWRSRRWCATGRPPSRCWSARRSTWCSPRTCSTSGATSPAARPAAAARQPARADPDRRSRDGPRRRGSWRVRTPEFEVNTIVSPRFARVAIHRLRGRAASAG